MFNFQPHLQTSPGSLKQAFSRLFMKQSLSEIFFLFARLTILKDEVMYAVL